MVALSDLWDAINNLTEQKALIRGCGKQLLEPWVKCGHNDSKTGDWYLCSECATSWECLTNTIAVKKKELEQESRARDEARIRRVVEERKADTRPYSPRPILRYECIDHGHKVNNVRFRHK